MRECNQCGKCCTNYGGGGGLSASAEEIDWWETARPDIARYVRDGKIWASPEMLKDDCEMLQAHDLADPGKAQKKLDLLMSDSRPPVDSAR
jgi:hypothetical protein